MSYRQSQNENPNFIKGYGETIERMRAGKEKRDIQKKMIEK